MNADEKIYIKSAWFESNEDDYEKGEMPGRNGASWTGADVCLKYGPYDTAGQALEAVCRANCFKYNPEYWGYEDGRFESGFTVDVDNTEATEDQIEAWKRHEERLWYCTAVVNLEVRSCRRLTDDEAKLG